MEKLKKRISKRYLTNRGKPREKRKGVREYTAGNVKPRRG